MVIYCSVYKCHNNASNKEVNFFRFPYSDESRCMAWWTQCKRSDRSSPGKGAYICSIHFKEEDYVRDLEHELLNLPIRRRLSKEAIPSLNMPTDQVTATLVGLGKNNLGHRHREVRTRHCARSIHIQKRKRKCLKDTQNDFDEPTSKIFIKSLTEEKENEESKETVDHVPSKTALCGPVIPPLSAVTVNCKLIQNSDKSQSANFTICESRCLSTTSNEKTYPLKPFTNCMRIDDIPCLNECTSAQYEQKHWNNLERKLGFISSKTCSAFERLCVVAEMMYYEQISTIDKNKPDCVHMSTQQKLSTGEELPNSCKIRLNGSHSSYSV